MMGRASSRVASLVHMCIRDAPGIFHSTRIVRLLCAHQCESRIERERHLQTLTQT